MQQPLGFPMKTSSNSHSDVKSRLFWFVSNLEEIFYFLVGAVTFGLGSVALARWAFESWQAGKTLSVISILAGAVAAPAAVLFFIRRQRPIVAIGWAMIWLGVVAYVLSGYGFSLPAWFG